MVEYGSGLSIISKSRAGVLAFDWYPTAEDLASYGVCLNYWTSMWVYS